MKKRPRGRPRIHAGKVLSNTERCKRYRKRLKRYVHFRSTRDVLSTPQAFFDKLDAEFGFTVDVCALPHNAKCLTYYSPEQDGLQQVWTGTCWCNPPYGTVIEQWVQKAYESAQLGATVVCLVPSRTDTHWWHDYVLPYAEIRFVPRRLHFDDSGNSAPFPSVVVIFRPTASVAESDQRLLDRLRWGKWSTDELQWLLSHMPDGASTQVAEVIQEKLGTLDKCRDTSINRLVETYRDLSRGSDQCSHLSHTACGS